MYVPVGVSKYWHLACSDVSPPAGTGGRLNTIGAGWLCTGMGAPEEVRKPKRMVLVLSPPLPSKARLLNCVVTAPPEWLSSAFAGSAFTPQDGVLNAPGSGREPLETATVVLMVELISSRGGESGVRLSAALLVSESSTPLRAVATPVPVPEEATLDRDWVMDCAAPAWTERPAPLMLPSTLSASAWDAGSRVPADVTAARVLATDDTELADRLIRPVEDWTWERKRYWALPAHWDELVAHSVWMSPILLSALLVTWGAVMMNWTLGKPAAVRPVVRRANRAAGEPLSVVVAATYWASDAESRAARLRVARTEPWSRRRPAGGEPATTLTRPEKVTT